MLLIGFSANSWVVQECDKVEVNMSNHGYKKLFGSNEGVHSIREVQCFQLQTHLDFFHQLRYVNFGWGGEPQAASFMVHSQFETLAMTTGMCKVSGWYEWKWKAKSNSWDQQYLKSLRRKSTGAKQAFPWQFVIKSLRQLLRSSKNVLGKEKSGI